MGYRRAILQRWSRRDWLTVVIIAVATAFLVGTTVLLLAAGAHAATVSGGLETSTTATHYDSVSEAEEIGGNEAVVFPLAVVIDDSGTEHTLIGIPPDAPAEFEDATTSWEAATVPSPGDPETVRGPVSEPTELRFAGQNETIAVTVTPHEAETIFPAWWHSAPSSTVETLGSTGAIVIEADEEITRQSASLLHFDQSDSGVPLVSALAFLLAGMGEVLRLLGAATVGGAVIVTVVLYSVTRISVQERLDTIEVIRSTGGTPAHVLTLYGARSTLIAAVGVVSGFAVGVLLTNLSVRVAIWAGIPVTLEPQVTLASLRVLVPMLVTLVVVGCLAGLIASWPAATGPPTAIRSRVQRKTTSTPFHRTESRLPATLFPTLLDWRTVIPTTATLTVFVLLVLLISGIGVAVEPVGDTEGGTVTAADAAHPIDSRLDAGTADALRSEGIAASPELVLAQVHDGQPYMARGANYPDFAAVTDAELIDGREPTSPDEAVIGRSLTETLDVESGDTITLGGSGHPGVARVTIVGVYEADGPADNQLIVPLETGHHLSLEPGTVHVIRTTEEAGALLGEADATVEHGSDTDSSAEERVVYGLNVPETAVVGETTTIGVHVYNDESTAVTRTLDIAVEEETYEQEVELAPGEEDRIEIEHTFGEAEERTVTVEEHSQQITVLESDALVLPDTLPTDAPPGATLLVDVSTPTGEAVSDTTVAIDGDETTTDANGVAQLELPENEGEYDITATEGDRDGATHTVQVTEGREQRIGVDLQTEPRTGTPETAPEMTMTVTNHWTETRTQDVGLVTPTGEQTQPVLLEPGESTTIETTVGEGESDTQLPPGEYEIVATVDGDAVATTEYEVVDTDFDLDAAFERGQYSSGAAMSHVVENTVGNIQLLLATMVGLAGLMTIGSTTAAFAQSVHARHETIAVYRATGAGPKRLLKIVGLDACRLAIPAALFAGIAALLAITVLDTIGVLSVFGVRFGTDVRPLLVLLTLLGAVCLAVCSAVLALLPALISTPASVWIGASRSGSADGDRPDE
ncbi:FtsX-like permease family protein [Natronorarus salvus]|uniref:FtsX-like permease family protein n=1 Tax=Natronorarus salvus TaxID=3117733 RepID=UPI002F260F52